MATAVATKPSVDLSKPVTQWSKADVLAWAIAVMTTPEARKKIAFNGQDAKVACAEVCDLFTACAVDGKIAVGIATCTTIGARGVMDAAFDMLHERIIQEGQDTKIAMSDVDVNTLFAKHVCCWTESDVLMWVKSVTENQEVYNVFRKHLVDGLALSRMLFFRHARSFWRTSGYAHAAWSAIPESQRSLMNSALDALSVLPCADIWRKIPLGCPCTGNSDK